MRAAPLAILLVASAAAAAPTVRLRVTGACPDAAAVARALPPEVRVVTEDDAGAALTIVVDGDADGAAVTLADARRTEAARIDGRDCAVLAAAVAALADVWLITLDAPPPPEEPPPPEAPPLPAPAPVDDDAPRWSLGVGRALAVGDTTALVGATQLDLTWRARWRDARVRVALDLGDRGALDTAIGEVTRRSWMLHATIGRRAARGRLWLGAGVGAGVIASAIDATDGAMEATTLRVHPAGVATIDAGVAIAAQVSIRLLVTGVAYPAVDRYTMEGVELGRSPRASVSASLGLDIGLGGR